MISGVFHASRIGSVDGSAGRTIVLSGVAAAVVGGVSLFGGRGRLAHAAIGAVVISMIDNGLGLLQMRAGVSFLVQGGVLLLAATIDALARRRGGVVSLFGVLVLWFEPILLGLGVFVPRHHLVQRAVQCALCLIDITL